MASRPLPAPPPLRLLERPRQLARQRRPAAAPQPWWHRWWMRLAPMR